MTLALGLLSMLLGGTVTVAGVACAISEISWHTAQRATGASDQEIARVRYGKR